MHDSNSKIRRVVDVGMTVLLLFLMAYQVTGETAHEWIGMAMTLLVIIHQVLNRRWYGAILKGKYTPYRALTTILNILLLASFALTAVCGMAMSGHAVPFLYGMLPVSFARTMHLSMSHWAFVLMGLHLGMHVPVMIAGMKLSSRAKTVAGIILTCAAGVGLHLFLQNRMPDYLFFRSVFAFLDYEKAAWRVLGGNLLMLVFWAFAGAQAALFLRALSQRKALQRTQRKDPQASSPLVPVIYLMAAVLLGLILYMGLLGQDTGSFGNAGSGCPPRPARSWSTRPARRPAAASGMTTRTPGWRPCRRWSARCATMSGQTTSSTSMS